jgi:hypothetical protein
LFISVFHPRGVWGLLTVAPQHATFVRTDVLGFHAGSIQTTCHRITREMQDLHKNAAH